MAKGYWVAHVDVHDPKAYEAYIAANRQAFEAYGARFLVRGAPQEVREGHQRARTVVVEFPTIDAARACYESPEYQAALALRAPASTADLLIIQGWEG